MYSVGWLHAGKIYQHDTSHPYCLPTALETTVKNEPNWHQNPESVSKPDAFIIPHTFTGYFIIRSGKGKTEKVEWSIFLPFLIINPQNLFQILWSRVGSQWALMITRVIVSLYLNRGKYAKEKQDDKLRGQEGKEPLVLHVWPYVCGRVTL